LLSSTTGRPDILDEPDGIVLLDFATRSALMRLVAAFLILFASIARAVAEQPNVADWSVSGQDLYAKCTSANDMIAHACGEYLLGVLDAAIGVMPANAQLFCPPSSLSFFQLETAYIKWAKANPDLLNQSRIRAAAGALSAAFPCR
jgi:hypothetical protein